MVTYQCLSLQHETHYMYPVITTKSEAWQNFFKIMLIRVKLTIWVSYHYSIVIFFVYSVSIVKYNGYVLYVIFLAIFISN